MHGRWRTSQGDVASREVRESQWPLDGEDLGAAVDVGDQEINAESPAASRRAVAPMPRPLVFFGTRVHGL